MTNPFALAAVKDNLISKKPANQLRLSANLCLEGEGSKPYIRAHLIGVGGADNPIKGSVADVILTPLPGHCGFHVHGNLMGNSDEDFATVK